VGKREMKLLSVIKNVCVMIGVAVTSDIYAMERELHQQRELELFSYEHTADKFMREWPLMSLNLLRYRYNRCDADTKKKIDEQFLQKEEMYKIYQYADIRVWEAVGNTLFTGSELYNFFLNVPIIKMHKMFEDRSWAFKVYNGKKALHFIGSMAAHGDTRNIIKKKLFKDGYIVRYADQIKKINCYLKDISNYYSKAILWGRAPLANRSILEAFDVLNKKIKGIHSDGGIKIKKDLIVYDYREVLTVKNVFNKFKNQREILVVYIVSIMPIITGCLSKFIERNHCQKILTADDIRFNERAVLFNEGLSRAKAQRAAIMDSLDHIILPYKSYARARLMFESPMEIIDPYYSWSDFSKINAPFFTAIFLLHIPVLVSLLRQGKIFYDDGSSPLAWVLVYGCVLKFVSWLILDSFQLSVVGTLVMVSAIFFGLACYNSLIEITESSGTGMSSVKIEDISNLLQKHDDGQIVIQ